MGAPSTPCPSSLAHTSHSRPTAPTPPCRDVQQVLGQAAEHPGLPPHPRPPAPPTHFLQRCGACSRCWAGRCSSGTRTSFPACISSPSTTPPSAASHSPPPPTPPPPRARARRAARRGALQPAAAAAPPSWAATRWVACLAGESVGVTLWGRGGECPTGALQNERNTDKQGLGLPKQAGGGPVRGRALDLSREQASKPSGAAAGKGFNRAQDWARAPSHSIECAELD